MEIIFSDRLSSKFKKVSFNYKQTITSATPTPINNPHHIFTQITPPSTSTFPKPTSPPLPKLSFLSPSTGSPVSPSPTHSPKPSSTAFNFICPSNSTSQVKQTTSIPTTNNTPKHTFFLDQKLSLYYGKYPSHVSLIKQSFGKPSTLHSFTSDVVLDHVLIFLFKTSYLSDLDLLHLRSSHPLYNHFYSTYVKFRHIDFRQLSQINTTYATQTTLQKQRLFQYTAALLHYNLHLGSVIRYCGNNYTNEHLNVPSIIRKLQNIVPQNIINYVHRALTTGAPTTIQGHSSHANFLDYKRYGNHVSITSRPDLVETSLNKEERNSYALPFPSWLSRFVPHLHLSPEGIIIKPGKKDRIVFDASFHIFHHSKSPNDWTSKYDEPAIYYGTAFLRHLERIWNLRITYPTLIIFLWDDDVSGAFRIVKYNPEIVGAFSAIVGSRLWVPVGQVFGGNTSAQNFEGLARARELLSEYYSQTSFAHLIGKHRDILSRISYAPNSSSSPLVQAISCSQHSGVTNPDGTIKNTPHNTFVDDNHIADVFSRIQLAQAASIEGLYQILGFPDTNLRRSPLSEDKYFRETCSPVKLQLGYLIDTNRMRVSFSESRFQHMLTTLSNWHSRRQQFTLREAATLAGELEFIASMCTWLRFITVSLKHSILLALRKNSQSILSNIENHELVADSHLLSTSFDDLSKKNFAVSQLLRKIWHKRTKYHINKSLRMELKLLHSLFKAYQVTPFWSPISHLIRRDPDFSAFGDACLDGAGGYSSSLSFWWFIEWPKAITKNTLRFYTKTYKSLSGNFVSINLLEYVTIIVSYAASILAINTSSSLPQPNPSVHIYSDNTTAVSWTKRAVSSTILGKNLGFLLTSLLISHPRIGLSSSHIAGKDNDLADKISRMKSSHKIKIPFSSILQTYPKMRDYKRYHPSPEILSHLWACLSSTTVRAIPKIEDLGHFTHDITSG